MFYQLDDYFTNKGYELLHSAGFMTIAGEPDWFEDEGEDEEDDDDSDDEDEYDSDEEDGDTYDVVSPSIGWSLMLVVACIDARSIGWPPRLVSQPLPSPTKTTPACEPCNTTGGAGAGEQGALGGQRAGGPHLRRGVRGRHVPRRAAVGQGRCVAG